MENSSEVSAEVLDQKMATNGTTNGSKEESESPEQPQEPVQSSKAKVVSEDSTEEDPEKAEECEKDSDSPVEPAVPTSVIKSLSKASEKVTEDSEQESEKVEAVETPVEDTEAAAEAPSCTVADLIEEEEEESPKAEEEEKKEENTEDSAADTAEMTEEDNKKVETKEDEDEEEEGEEESTEGDESKKEEARSVKQDTKTAAELAYEWDDDGIEDEKPSPSKTPKKKPESKPKESPSVDLTPGRKSSRTPKPTQRKLESESQKNLKPEEEEEEGDEEDEESVDAIAKELEKSDSDKSPSSGGKKLSAKKGKKPVSEEKSKEEWVNLIFGENGEKVTEKGVKGGDTKKGGDAKDAKAEGEDEEGPETEEFLPEDTPKAKKGGRPKKKGLDETLDGVAKLGSNMYFYTGPGGSDSPPPLDSDEEDLPIKKADSEPARKSSRANKGRNTRLERGDEVVDIPQVKEAPKPNLNPSWLKNHDSKSSPVKKGTTPVVKTVAKTTPAKPAEKKETKKETKKEAKKEEVKDKEEEKEEAMDTSEEVSETPEAPVAPEAEVEAEETKEEEAEEAQEAEETLEAAKGTTPTPDDGVLEFDPDKFTPGYVPKTVKKGDEEYMIVVSGVKDTGLCGNYWNVQDGGRRRSKPPETLQMGKEKRRGSVGSVGSETSGKESPVSKKGAATPASAKSSKKQVTKPEKVEQEEVEESKTPVGRGRKRKTEETPTSKVKAAKKEAEDDTKEFSDYDSGNNETQPLRKRPKKDDGDGGQEAALTSKQQTAVANALAAGVPGGQQRSVSCVADTNTQKEVVVECFAPYDDHRWVNIGKERDGMAPDAVQYARALRPPYHLLSFLRIKGHSTKGMSCTDKNTMVFVVLEGEITVILHTTQFNAKKGDSFYIPPKNYYNLINQKAREAELSLIQFQYDGPLPTVQPSSS